MKEIKRTPCRGGNVYSCCHQYNSGAVQLKKIGDLTYYDLGLTACGQVYTNKDMVAAIAFGHFTTPNPNLDPMCGKKVKIVDPGTSKSIIVTFNVLFLKIKDKITKQNTPFRESIPPKEKLAVYLRFLATGDSYQTISFSFRLGHSNVQSIVLEVCEAIISNMKEETMPTPKKEDWERISNEFWEIWNFPNCIGALDGKHVVIEAPPNSGSLYFNYKKTFSIVLLALVDAQYKFIAVDIGTYGKNSDGGILSHSNMGKALEKNKMNIPSDRELPGTNEKLPYVIIGDEAFPLKNYLLRPYPSPQIYEDEQKKVFNERLLRARKVVEDAFGQITAKFRIYCRRLKALPQNADKIVMTTCILHNFIKKDGPETQNHELPLNSTSLPNHIRSFPR
ncbi:hypothetical protein QTP88_024537 [Uroleucon formosanum]